jgi:hypothetical protein
MDVSGRILARLDAGHPCRHDGDLYFRVLWESVRFINDFVMLENLRGLGEFSQDTKHLGFGYFSRQGAKNAKFG